MSISIARYLIERWVARKQTVSIPENRAVRVVGNDNEAPKRAYDMYKDLVGTHHGITVKAGGIIATGGDFHHGLKKRPQ